ncbi:MAG: hypothetical protein ACKV0T_22625 [Planctomycetales bacterium]
MISTTGEVSMNVRIRSRPIVWIFLAGLVGCCAPLGDPSCALQDELCAQPHLRRAAYCPDLSLEGLNETGWYLQPTGWTPECPGLSPEPPLPNVPPSRDRVFAEPRSKAARQIH